MHRENLKFLASVIILSGALFCLRLLTPAFEVGNSFTKEHPVAALCALIIIAGIAWFSLLEIFRRTADNSAQSFTPIGLPVIIILGVILRLAFFDTPTVYENDYKRYLWDGAVTAIGANPYEYSPQEIFNASKPGTASAPDLARLAVLSNQAEGLTGEINSPVLTTIYPPAAQAVFTLAYWVAPFKPWALKLIFLFIEIIGLAILLLGLARRNLPLLWSALYWLNPVIIFTTYNGMHMDVLLVAPILAAVLWAEARPILAAAMLSLAAAIKIWPLILAPILFRSWRHKPIIYMGIAALIAILIGLSLLPMLLLLGDSAGLVAYSANWTNSSFVFPGLRSALGVFSEDPNRLARYVVAIILTGLSLWFGFISKADPKHIPAHLLLLMGLFVLLSPTGYPWYFIWFLMFLPFALTHWSARGLSLLTIGAAAYFARFKLGELGNYHLFENYLLPLEFGIPILVLIWDGYKVRAHA